MDLELITIRASLLHVDTQLYYLLDIICKFVTAFRKYKGAQWLSGRVLDSRRKGCGFKPHRRHCVLVLEQDIFPSLVLVQPRKTHPCLTERLLMGREESNQTKQRTLDSLNEGLPIEMTREKCQRNDIFSMKRIVGSTLDLSTKAVFSLDKYQSKNMS